MTGKDIFEALNYIDEELLMMVYEKRTETKKARIGKLLVQSFENVKRTIKSCLNRSK